MDDMQVHKISARNSRYSKVLFWACGAVLVARLTGSQEVRGSNPLRSTSLNGIRL